MVLIQHLIRGKTPLTNCT